jgi:hypothetical protein
MSYNAKISNLIHPNTLIFCAKLEKKNWNTRNISYEKNIKGAVSHESAPPVEL